MASFQVPHSDSAYVGLATFDIMGSNEREYVACELTNPMQVNQLYWVEFYTSVGEGNCWCGSNNLGVYFSDTALHSTNGQYFDVNAQLKYFNNEIIDDTVNWIKVSGLYQAQGGEQFITLGNFNTDAETIHGPYYSYGANNGTYFLIDDVSVIPLDSIPGGIPVDAGPDQVMYIGDSAFIGQKISNMPDMWSELSGAPVASNTAGVYVSPSVNTTYVVTRNLNGFYSTDTVTVFVNGLGLGEEKKERIGIYPVPNNGSFFINGQMNVKDKVMVYSSDGKKVFEYCIQEEQVMISIDTKLSSGSYNVKLVSASDKELFNGNIVILEKE